MSRALCSILFAGIVASTTALGQAPTSASYFPPGSFDDIWGPHYSSVLQQSGEAPLARTASATRQVYRFIWVPSFHAAAVVRVERDRDRITVTATRLPRGAAGERWGKSEPPIQKTLSATEWSFLSKQVAAARFWSMTSKEAKKRDANGNQYIQLDGDTWLLEGVDASRHHVVARWYHDDYAAFETACYCMLEWSGLGQTLVDIEGYGYGVKGRLTSRCSRRAAGRSE